MRFDLIIMMRDMYINCKLNLFTKLSSSNRSTEKNTLRDGGIERISSMLDEVTSKNGYKDEKGN